MKVNQCLMLLASAAACVAALVWVSPSWAQTIPYRTDFEDSAFTVGDLGAGQDGWSATAGSGAIQTPDNVRSGTQSLEVNPASVVSRNLDGFGSDRVYIDGYYRGPTVSETPDPTTLADGSSLVLFHSTNGIMALDGNGTGGGIWVPANPIVPVATQGLQRMTVCQNYTTQAWDLYVDKVLIFAGLGFKNDSIDKLNGIDIETSDSGSGFLDDFSATTAIPEFFSSGMNISLFEFSGEWGGMNETTFEYDYPERNDNVNANDLTELLDRLAE